MVNPESQFGKEGAKWLNDIQEIKEKVETRKKERKDFLDKKEMIREAVLEKTKAFLKEGEGQFSKKEKEEVRQDDKFKEEALREAVELAKREGILEGVKFTIKKKDPWLIDAFHDKIIEEIEKAVNI